jgi:hypothetical protein
MHRPMTWLGEQGGGTVPLVVVSHRAQAAALERQARLGAGEGLDLAFLIDRQDHGMGGRIDVLLTITPIPDTCCAGMP